LRNFTYREADELGASLRLAEGRRADDPAGAEGTVAEVFGPPSGRGRDAPALPSRPRPRPRPQDRLEARFAHSALLVGSEELAPPFERQLDFSERGAAYTLSVPAARLMQVLARFQLDEEHETALRVESEQAGDAPTDEQRWLKDWPLAKQAAEALDAHGRNAVILLPVVVEESD
jgi:hypothetical protein